MTKEIVVFINNSQDDSDLKKMQVNYKKLEKKKNNIVNELPDGYYKMCDYDGNCTNI